MTDQIPAETIRAARAELKAREERLKMRSDALFLHNPRKAPAKSVLFVAAWVSMLKVTMGLTGRGYRNAYAGITLPNAVSLALHRAVGFQPIGTFPRIGYKLGAWRDVAWMHRPLGEGDVERAPGEVPR